MTHLLRPLVLLLALLPCAGCLVITLQPIYDEASIVFDEKLIGQWQAVDDKASLTIERAEWRSYRVLYQEAVAKLQLTGYLTAIGAERFLDITPQRGEDPGPFLIPAHAAYRVKLSEAGLSIEAMNYDWFSTALKAKSLKGLDAALDGRQNVMLTSATPVLRKWMETAMTRPQPLAPPTMYRRK